ncbi:MAG TPA: hypothetical protein VHQ00_14430, partial [Chloroflexota bacterium]|nr:hypothetical protein [Chloroflexota bacterium]
MIRAGAATVDITPPLGVPLAGSFTARYAVDVDDPLSCRAVVLEDDTGPGGRVAFVLCDLICLPGPVMGAVRDLLAGEEIVPPQRVLVAATHTHTAPSPTGLLGTPPATAYMEALP